MTHRVLIVEDEAVVAMLLEDMLADLGHEAVAVAGRIDKALELARSAEIDLAILDVNLNGQPTYPVAEILKSRGVPFAFATGYGVSGLAEEWRSTPVLQKPFHARELAQAIAKARPAG
jgi:CheY-like chemotaxis protein